ncbi:MAG TPA: ABC transporter substrate-binding protein [Streptosporangiales bacterium]
MGVRALATRWAGAILGLALVAAGASACGGSTSRDAGGTGGTGSSVSVTRDAKAAKLLPASLVKSGLVVAMDGTQGKPFTYYGSDNKTLAGVTVDLGDALGKALGVKVTVKNTSFDSLIPGLAAGRYDLAIAPMLMTPERLKQVDMIGWVHGGSSFVVKKGVGKPDLTPSAVCGMTVGAATGSVEAEALAAQSTKCVKAGKKPVQRKLFPHATDGVVALTAGRLDAYDTASAQAAFIAKQNGQVTQSGHPYSSGTSSMALPKGSKAAQAVAAGLQHLIDTGAYKQILSRYGMQGLAVPAAAVDTPK